MIVDSTREAHPQEALIGHQSALVGPEHMEIRLNDTCNHAYYRSVAGDGTWSFSVPSTACSSRNLTAWAIARARHPDLNVELRQLAADCTPAPSALAIGLGSVTVGSSGVAVLDRTYTGDNGTSGAFAVIHEGIRLQSGSEVTWVHAIRGSCRC